MGVEVVKMEALQLSPEDRAYLARELLTSLDVMSEADIERLWITEAIRRDDEIDNGASQTYPVEDVLARARARRRK
jgi:putative addiction module component (TIGR02574 family)